MRKLKISELNRLTVSEFKETEKTPIIIILDNIRSLNNIGSVFRTADAFRIQAIYLCGITACPPHRDIHKTALGATDSVNWKYFKDTKDAVKLLVKEKYIIFSIEQTTESISLSDISLDNNKKYAVIFGNEAKGIDQQVIDLSDSSIEIPQFGTKHSLNISVSAGIVIWELFTRLQNH